MSPSLRLAAGGLFLLLSSPALASASARRAAQANADGLLPPLLIPASVPGRRLPVADATTQDDEIQALRKSGLDWKEIEEFLSLQRPTGLSPRQAGAAVKRKAPGPERPRP